MFLRGSSVATERMKGSDPTSEVDPVPVAQRSRREHARGSMGHDRDATGCDRVVLDDRCRRSVRAGDDPVHVTRARPERSREKCG